MRLADEPVTNPDDVLIGLDADQRNAVTAPPGVVVVRAGAGSGKTTVLTRRVAWRIASATASADHTLAITFTRQAAAEMRTRLHRLGIDGSPSVHTFHALGLRVLNDLADDLGRTRPTVTTNRGALLAQAAGDDVRRQDIGALAAAIDWVTVRMIDPADSGDALRITGLARVLDATGFASIVARYDTIKRRRGVLDTNDLIASVVKEVRRDTRIAASLQRRFRHVSVDEAQDMNPLQYEFLRVLTAEHRDVFLVGDPHQAIYGFNGADNSLFDDLPGLPGATVVSLPSNYRCTPEVVGAATKLLGNAGQPVDSVSVRPRGREVRWVPCTDETDERARIASLLSDMQGRAGTWNVLAVLARTNALAESVAADLAERGVPVRSTRRGPDWSAAVAATVALPGREAMSVWSSDILDTADQDGPPEFTEVASLVRTYLDENRGRSVDGRSFGSWLLTAVDRSDVSGVEVMTFHAAKGRQWWGVVVAGAEEGLLPHSSARTRAQKAEEARLAYVAFTRAADELAVTWAATRAGKPRKRTSFLPVAATVVTALQSPGADVRRIIARAPRPHPVAVELDRWRVTVARRTRLEAAGILSDRQIARIVAELPTSVEELAEITDRPFAARHGAAILAIINPAG